MPNFSSSKESNLYSQKLIPSADLPPLFAFSILVFASRGLWASKNDQRKEHLRVRKRGGRTLLRLEKLQFDLATALS
jgi:hypothetical protein